MYRIPPFHSIFQFILTYPQEAYNQLSTGSGRFSAGYIRKEIKKLVEEAQNITLQASPRPQSWSEEAFHQRFETKMYLELCTMRLPLSSAHFQIGKYDYSEAQS